MQNILNWVWARLNEGSTWAGFAGLDLAVQHYLQLGYTLQLAFALAIMAVLLPDKGATA